MNATMFQKMLGARQETTVGLPRRSFLKAIGGAGGALVIGFGFAAEGTQAAPAAATSEFALNAFVRIGRDNSVTVMIPSSEMGQGVSTALAMVIAEELDLDWQQVHTEFAPNDPVYKNLIYGLQLTGGSTTVRSFWEPLAKTGAAAREMLLTAAAQRWSVPVSELTAEKGQVLHAASRSE